MKKVFYPVQSRMKVDGHWIKIDTFYNLYHQQCPPPPPHPQGKGKERGMGKEMGEGREVLYFLDREKKVLYYF